MLSPLVSHWAAVEHILCYFLDVEYCIRIMDIPELSAFLMQIGQDLRKIGDTPQDIVFFGGNLISWKSKK